MSRRGGTGHKNKLIISIFSIKVSRADDFFLSRKSKPAIHLPWSRHDKQELGRCLISSLLKWISVNNIRVHRRSAASATSLHLLPFPIPFPHLVCKISTQFQQWYLSAKIFRFWHTHWRSLGLLLCAADSWTISKVLQALFLAQTTQTTST